MSLDRFSLQRWKLLFTINCRILCEIYGDEKKYCCKLQWTLNSITISCLRGPFAFHNLFALYHFIIILTQEYINPLTFHYLVYYYLEIFCINHSATSLHLQQEETIRYRFVSHVHFSMGRSSVLKVWLTLCSFHMCYRICILLMCSIYLNIVYRRPCTYLT